MKQLKGILISLAILAVFTLLMVYALKHNPNFTPSQLIGKEAPNIQSVLSTGQAFSFNKDTYPGRWKVINFWTSSCSICKREANTLQNFYENVTLKSPKNPYLISINLQDNAKIISQWQKDYSQTFPVVQDTNGIISIQYGVTGTPETFFVDTKNIVRFRIAGEIQINEVLQFIQWLETHPSASENDASEALSKIYAGVLQY